jgi:hypothetical protein
LNVEQAGRLCHWHIGSLRCWGLVSLRAGDESWRRAEGVEGGEDGGSGYVADDFAEVAGDGEDEAE